MLPRAFVVLAAIVFAIPLTIDTRPTSAQAPKKLASVVFIGPASDQDANTLAGIALFRQTLAEAGHAEGKTLRLDVRYLAGRFDRLPDVLTDSVGRNADVIVVVGTMAAIAAKG